MTLGFRGKLFLASVALILVVGLISAAYLERELRTSLEERIETELLRHARTGCALVEDVAELGSVERTDALADDLGEATEARVTIVALDGEVLGDSWVPLAEIAAMENHADRPEIRDAHADSSGPSRRYSTTVETDMLYVAVPYERGAERGVVRVATPLSAVDAAIRRLRVILGVAALLGLALALLSGGLTSHWLSRNVRELVGRTRSLVEGRPGAPPVAGSDELGFLAESINVMGEELRRNVEELGAERDRFEAVLEGMEASVVALDEQRRVTLINRSARELLGLDQVSEGTSLLELVRVPQLHELLEDTAGGDTAFCELELPGNPPRQITARATPQRATGGAVLVMHDETRRRRLETMRRDFVANVSHELRTPVSIVRANAETLLDGALEDPAAGRNFTEAILRNAERLSRLIADLLDLTRIESGKLEVQLHPVGVRAAIQRAVESVDRPARDRNVTITHEASDELSVAADDKALDQVLTNLIDNAVKYIHEGGQVAVRARRIDGMVRFEVEDDGPGIEPRHRDRIFERFYRVDTGRSREMGGTGLGLAIVKHLVGAMKGQGGVLPASPHGCVFWLEIPVTDE